MVSSEPDAGLEAEEAGWTGNDIGVRETLWEGDAEERCDRDDSTGTRWGDIGGIAGVEHVLHEKADVEVLTAQARAEV